MIEICNLRNCRCVNEYDVKVDRSSILGNPFYMKDESMREEVIRKYNDYFLDKINEDGKFKDEFYRLISIYKKYKKLRLFCWCAPKKCHAEVIKFYIEYKLRLIDIKE